MKCIKYLMVCIMLLVTINPSVQASFAEDTMGSSNSDLALTVLGGAGLASASCVVEHTTIKWALRLCAVAPLIAHILPEQTIKLLNNVPLLKDYLQLSSKILPCSNTCDGICKKCKVKRLYQLYPMILAPIGISTLLEKTNPAAPVIPNQHPTSSQNVWPPQLRKADEEGNCAICLEESQNQCPQCNAHFHQECWNRALHPAQVVREKVTHTSGYYLSVDGSIIDDEGFLLVTQPGTDRLRLIDNVDPIRAYPNQQPQPLFVERQQAAETRCPVCRHDFANKN